MLDGLMTVEELVDETKRHGQLAATVTDHGVMCGLPSFYHYARKNDIEPILGQEFYYVPDATVRPTKGATRDPGDKARYHIGLLARGDKGYRVLSELSTEAFRNFYHKPLIDRRIIEALGRDAKHLVCMSGCAASALSVHILAGNMDLAAEELMYWRESFPHYYIELMHHDTPFDRVLNKGLIKLAKKFKVPWIITNDPHYATHGDEGHHDALLAIQTAADIDDPNRFRFDGTGYHLRSRLEMRRTFKEYGKEIWEPGFAETVNVAKLCHTRIPEWEKRTWQIPKFPDVDDAYEYVKTKAQTRLKELRLHQDITYLKRMVYELKVIKEVGISDFLLITLDIIEEANRRGIPVGPGRGSVCGTLVGYLIGLHKIDPVKYDLMFERFLNPARPRMPDIDTDLGQARRAEMFDYIPEKYGKENVLHVCTYQKMRNKAAFQSLAAAYGVSHPDRIRISKQLAKDGIEDDDYLPEEITKNYPDLAGQLQRLSGVNRAISTHPAGVIIASPETNIRRLVPELYIPKTKRWVGQYDLDAVEEMGLLKEDLLGLRTLDTIAECVRFVRERQDIVLDPDSWVPDEEPDDQEAYEYLTTGKTAGIFQMEGRTNTAGIMAVKCTCFEDIVSTTSLYRTGPIMAGYPKKFLENRKHSKKKIPYAHPLLRDILERTWGVILYQEQVMAIGEVLAGFNMEQVDDIKEAIKHKKSKLMAEMRPLFIAGCKKNGIPVAISTAIWDDIEGYSGYSYNRSHAVAYSFLTFQTLKLKYMYPLEYHAAMIRTVGSDDKDRRALYLQSAVEAGYKMLPPDVNQSDAGAVPDASGEAIRFGLVDYVGVGEKLAARLVQARPEGGFTDPSEVEAALRHKTGFDTLARGSGMESLGISGNATATEQLLSYQFRDGMARYRKEFRHELSLPEGDGECIIMGEITRCAKSQTKTGKDFMTWDLRYSPSRTFTVRLWSGTEKAWSCGKGSIVILGGKWEARWGNVGVSDPRNIKVVKRVKAKVS